MVGDAEDSQRSGERVELRQTQDGPPQQNFRTCDVVPDAVDIPAGVRVVELSFAMNSERLPDRQEESLESLVRSLRERSIKLVLQVSVHQGNWIHLRSWLMLARRVGIVIVPRLVPLAERGSLADLDGDALACLHGIFLHWLQEYPSQPDQDQASASQSADTLLAYLRRWQRDAASRSPSRENLILPDRQHSLVRDENALERFLGELLRIHEDFRIERWMTDIAQSGEFVEEARRRRSLRLIAFWLVCVFRRVEMVRLLGEILGEPEDAARSVKQDAKALTGTSWEGWFDGWTEQLRLKSLMPREQRFVIGPPRLGRTGESARTTVIIPSYNHEAFIGDAIRSVLGQTCTDFEVLIVDDASSDRTVEEAQKLENPRIRITRNPRNLGLGSSLGRALESVNTEFVAFLNSDDLFHPRRLETCLERLAGKSELALIATGLAPVDSKGRICSAADSSPVFDGQEIHDWLNWYEGRGCMKVSPQNLPGALLERNFLITSSNLVARTEFMRQHQEAWRDLEFCVDWQIFLLAAVKNKLCYVPDSLLGYRLHKANTIWFDPARRWRYYLEVNLVVARLLESLFKNGAKSPKESFSAALRTITDYAAFNTNVDWPGVLLGLFLERLGLHPRNLEGEAVADRLSALDRARNFRLESEFWHREYGDKLTGLYRMREEYPFLRSVRNCYEAVRDDYDRLQRSAEKERDRLLSSYEHRLGDLLLNRLRLRAPLQAAHRFWVIVRNGLSL